MMFYSKDKLALILGGTTGTGSPGNGTGGAIPPYRTDQGASGGSGGEPPPYK